MKKERSLCLIGLKRTFLPGQSRRLPPSRPRTGGPLNPITRCPAGPQTQGLEVQVTAVGTAIMEADVSLHPPISDGRLWDLMRQATVKMNARIPESEPLSDDKMTKHVALVLMMLVFTSEPEPATLDELKKVSPYSAESVYLKGIEALMGLGYLAEARPRSYRLTAKGRDAVRRRRLQAEQAVAEWKVLSAPESLKTADLLYKVVKEAMASEPPPEPWFCRHVSRLLVPAGTLARAMGCLMCLEAYRDDSHHAAWKEAGLNATEEELLTLLWQEKAKSVAEVQQLLPYREQSDDSYRVAARRLSGLGLVNIGGDSLQLTDEGRKVRNNIETSTDHYFFRSWHVLDENDRRFLEDALEQVAKAEM